MIKLKLTKKSDVENNIWVDPAQIASVVPDEKTGGSIITLKQKNFFKVWETPSEVMLKSCQAKTLNEGNFGNQ